MNAQEAKRAACWRAAGVVENALAGGWDELDRLYGDDAGKVRAALNDVVAELERRGGGS